MSKSKVVFLGILSFLPVLFIALYFVLFFGFFLTGIVEAERAGNQDDLPIAFFTNMVWLMGCLLLGITLSVGLMVYYIVHAHNNPKNDNSKKIMWTLILIFVGLIGNIVYFFVEILPLRKPSLSSTSG